ncbi:acyltransferase [Rhodopseudomonas sp. B29]|uniref:acyltransferase family protein n=1 Tax=Rhodopseudomonas sp. B29 TaxID=95607 RepID=UPI00034BBB4B|nr:acyltransferase [Rhodopseudomonas sp. B29]
MQIEATAIPAQSAEPVAQPATTTRNGGIDALRAVMTLLVLFHHTAITYGASGGWFYHELPAGSSPSARLLTLFVATNQAYFMGLFFLLAGYFTPGAIRAKGPLLYIRDRALRLGLPLLAFGLVLGPFTEAMALAVQGRPFTPTLLAIWHRGYFIEGPLWFAEALLIFGVAALVWFVVSDRLSPAAAGNRREAPFPSNATIAAAALLTAAAAFVVRFWWPVGASWHGLQFGYFPGYVVLFVAGCAAAAPRWLERVPPHTARLWLIIALTCYWVLPAVSLLAPAVPALRGTSDGGWTWPALIYAAWEPAVACGLILALLVAFQRRFTQLTPVWRRLSERAYAIYIIHPPVLVALALAWRSVAAPAVVKFAVTGAATCLACYLLAGLLLRVPGARRVL